MNDSPIEYNQRLEYLPELLKDFHDQKDLFKSMHSLYSARLEKELPAFNFRDSQIYTIDFFLWFMGIHGYKLQKSKKKGVKFFNINETISEHKEKVFEKFKLMINNRQPK